MERLDIYLVKFRLSLQEQGFSHCASVAARSEDRAIELITDGTKGRGSFEIHYTQKAGTFITGLGERVIDYFFA